MIELATSICGHMQVLVHAASSAAHMHAAQGRHEDWAFVEWLDRLVAYAWCLLAQLCPSVVSG